MQKNFVTIYRVHLYTCTNKQAIMGYNEKQAQDYLSRIDSQPEETKECEFCNKQHPTKDIQSLYGNEDICLTCLGSITATRIRRYAEGSPELFYAVLNSVLRLRIDNHILRYV